MNTQQEKEVMSRVKYFTTHYLPWILLLLLIVGVSICIFHYKKKSCIFEEKNKEESKVKDNLLQHKYISLHEKM